MRGHEGSIVPGMGNDSLNVHRRDPMKLGTQKLLEVPLMYVMVRISATAINEVKSWRTS